MCLSSTGREFSVKVTETNPAEFFVMIRSILLLWRRRGSYYESHHGTCLTMRGLCWTGRVNWAEWVGVLGKTCLNSAPWRLSKYWAKARKSICCLGVGRRRSWLSMAVEGISSLETLGRHLCAAYSHYASVRMNQSFSGGIGRGLGLNVDVAKRLFIWGLVSVLTFYPNWCESSRALLSLDQMTERRLQCQRQIRTKKKPRAWA